MLKKYFKDIENKPATLSDGTPVEDVYVRWLIDENDGAHNFAMRRFEIRPNGKVPLHNHSQDHEIYILYGSGVFFNDSEEIRVQPGDAIYIPPNEEHGINNTGTDSLVFLCLIPYLQK
ncbi:MAG: cupin domain-containing protein [Candidatus Heimdallarchaeota archaeon]